MNCKNCDALYDHDQPYCIYCGASRQFIPPDGVAPAYSNLRFLKRTFRVAALIVILLSVVVQIVMAGS